MPYSLDDTIAAIASARGGGMRGIVRISGDEAIRIALRAFVTNPPIHAESIRSTRQIAGQWQLPPPLGVIECGLSVWPTHRSYTRQPIVEVHTYGSPPILDAVLMSVCSRGARLAEPGEFTLRAFLAGRIDLTQAEAVLGIIDAEDDRQLHHALAQMAGGLTGPLNALRENLLELVAELEATLDFAEDDLELIGRREIQARLTEAAGMIAHLRSQLHSRGERSEVPRVVLAGLPNTGKSSLFNAMLKEPAAIVSARSGTTRDYVVRRVELDGLELQLIDTAGFADGGFAMESEAASQRVRHEQIAAADLVLLCLDASRSLHPWEESALARASQDNRTLIVWTKCDAGSPRITVDASHRTSSQSGSGIGELCEAIARQLATRAQPNSHAVASTAARCGDSLRRAAAGVRRAEKLVRGGVGDEYVAAELRDALDELGKVAGTVYTDDILDRVFSRFCIGK